MTGPAGSGPPPPVESGPPDLLADEMLLGSLLHWPAAQPDAGARALLDDVHADDFTTTHASALYGVLRDRLLAGRGTHPVAVLDGLQMAGARHELRTGLARSLTARGADPLWARQFAAALVADALRRRVADAGEHIAKSAIDSSEADMVRLVADLASQISDHAGRLARLRREGTHQ